MKKKILMGLSYVAVAVLSCALSVAMVSRNIPSTKLIALENQIL